MLVALALALCVGIVLGLLGAGGSILTVPILIFFAHVGPKSAVISSLVVVGTTILVAAIQHRRKGRVRLRVAISFALTGIPGALLGGWLSRPLSPDTIRLLFAGVMVASAIGMLFRREGKQSAEPPRRGFSPAAVAIGFFVGVLTGVVGAGGGFLIVPALVLLAGVPMGDAVGTSLVVITLNCVAGLAGKWGSAPVDWRFTLEFTACAVGGSFLGLGLTGRVSPRMLRRVFALLVLGIAVFLALGK
jgi:uncharacterized membrane protein YfcA